MELALWIVERRNLARALKRVRQNNGIAGVDGTTVDELVPYLRDRWRAGDGSLLRLYAKLTLQVNTEKSAVARVWDRQFLGFSFWVAPGLGSSNAASPRKALTRMKDRIRDFTSRSGGCSIAHVVTRLRSYLIAWRAYFRLADTPHVFAELEQLLHRRLRALHLKHWKHRATVHRELRRRGVSHHVDGRALRWQLVAGGWHAALHLAPPTSYFDQLGVPRLVAH